MKITIQWVDIPFLSLSVQFYTFHKLLSLQLISSSFCQRHIAEGIQAHQVFHRDAEIFHHLITEVLFQLHAIGVLHIIWLLVGFSIKINNMIFYLKSLSRKTNTTFHIILTTIGRTGDNLSIFLLVLLDKLSASLIDGLEELATYSCIKGIRVRTLRIALITNLITQAIEIKGLVFQA